MLKSELLEELKELEYELLRLEDKIEESSVITSLNNLFYKWKLKTIKDKLNSIEAQLLDGAIDKSFKFINLFLLGLVIGLLVVGAVFVNFWGCISLIMVITILAVLRLLKKIERRTMNIESNKEWIIKLNRELEKVEQTFDLKKIEKVKNTNGIGEDLAMQIFETAYNDLNEMVESENVNLNYNDRDYRKFIINLYDLKLNERELNNFYRQVIKLLLQDDLRVNEENFE